MATFTAFLGLRKPASSDSINVTLDLSDNFDEIDTAIAALDGRVESLEEVTHQIDTASVNWSSTTAGAPGVVLDFGSVPAGKYTFVCTGSINYSTPGNPNCVYRLVNNTTGTELARCDFTLLSGLTFWPISLTATFNLAATGNIRTEIWGSDTNGTKLTQTVRGVLIPCGTILGS